MRSCLGGRQLQSDRWCGDMWWTENHQSYLQAGRCWWSSQIRGEAKQRGEIFDTRWKRRVTPHTLITSTAVVWGEWRRLRDSTRSAEEILLIWVFIYRGLTQEEEAVAIKFGNDFSERGCVQPQCQMAVYPGWKEYIFLCFPQIKQRYFLFKHIS